MTLSICALSAKLVGNLVSAECKRSNHMVCSWYSSGKPVAVITEEQRVYVRILDGGGAASGSDVGQGHAAAFSSGTYSTLLTYTSDRR